MTGTPLTHHPAPVREYTSAAQLIADARALKRRMFAPTGIADRQSPTPVHKIRPVVESAPPKPENEQAMRAMASGFWCPSMPGQKILKALAAEAEANGCDILSRSTKHVDNRARQRAMVILAMAKPDLSVSCISGMFDRDHSTVLHAFRKLGYAHGRNRGMIYPRRRLNVGAM